MSGESAMVREEAEKDSGFLRSKSMFAYQPEEDNLRLTNIEEKMFNSKSGTSFPEAIIEKLKDEVEGLELENSRLRKSLIEAEKKAQVTQNDLPSPFRGLGRASDLAASRIVSLTKKVRELNAKLNTAENKASKAEAQLAVYMASQNMAAAKENEPEPEPSLIEAKDNQIKELADKLNSANNRICEYRNQVQSLRQELKLCQKALASEIGDEATVQSVIAGNGATWRGRAQQILNLQQKIAELTAKLSPSDAIGKEKSALSIVINEKHAEKEKVAQLSKDVENLKNDLTEYKTKNDAAKARIKALTTEVTSFKGQVQSLTAKTSCDEQIIDKLTKQLTELLGKSQEREEQTLRPLKAKINDLNGELKQEKAKSEQLREIITEKESKISQLEDKITSPTNPKFEMPPLRPSSRASSGEKYTFSPSSLQTSDAERMRLMELVTSLNRRLENERRNFDKLEDEMRRERQRGAKLETKLARLEMERVASSRSSNYYKSPNSAKNASTLAEMESLKDKHELLTEKCLALETRVETLRREKEDEYLMFQNVIAEMRNTFEEHLQPKFPTPAASLHS